MYTIADFRANMRKAFDDANQGHEVVIERYDQKYQLVALVDEPLPGHSFESTPVSVVPKSKPSMVLATATTSTELACCESSTPCKHWRFDGLNDTWVNTLSGRQKQAEVL